MEEEQPTLSSWNEAKERSFQDDLRQLRDDARELAGAELAYQKARATYAGKQAVGILVLIVAAAVFVFFALMALVVGMVIALIPWLTAWGSTAAVTIGLLLVALACLLFALGRWKRTKVLITDDRSQ